MVMTVGAINKFGDEQQAQTEEADEAARREKSKNVMYRPNEKTGGEKPIDLIKATQPPPHRRRAAERGRRARR